MSKSAVNRLAFWVLCTYVLVFSIYNIGFEGPWYPLQKAMEGGLEPPFSHRILFIGLAKAVKLVLPSARFARCFFVSQIVAVALALWATERWCDQVAKGSSLWSQPILVGLLTPSITYWTFYDMGLVFFFAACLTALVTRRYALYLILLGVATLNHENIVTLVPVAYLLRYRSWRPTRGGLLWVVSQLAIYAIVRIVLFRLIPVHAAWQEGKLSYNLHLFASNPTSLLKPALVGLTVAMVIASGWKRIPFPVRASLLLVPELGVITVFFGQLNELRQFDGAFPAVAAAIVCALQGGEEGRIVTQGRGISASRPAPTETRSMRTPTSDSIHSR